MFCAIFTALEQLRAKESADVSQLVKSFYASNPGVAHSQVCIYFLTVILNFELIIICV